MSSPVEITTKLHSQFVTLYDAFLFAPRSIQEALYIDSQLRLDVPYEKILNLKQLCDKVIEGVERSFLILGDSGSGKTSFALKLCETFWGKDGLNIKKIIPIYVYLPRLVVKVKQNESEFNIVTILVEEFRIHGIERCEGQIIFILDSFDEISTFPQRSKIVQNIWTNTSSWSADVSVVTCSRPEAVPNLKRQEMFEYVKFGHVSNRKYSEYTLEGLSEDRISNFLDKMEIDIIPQLRNCNDEELTRWSAWGTLKNKTQNWQSGDYNRWFKDLPDLKKLSENPYVLTLICLALPGIVLKLNSEEKVLKKLCKTRVGIFHAFTQQIFEYQAERVSQRPDNLKPGAQNISYRDWLIYFRAYAQNLAGKMFNYANEESVVKMSDEDTLDSSLVEPVLNSAQLGKLEEDHKDLFPPRLTHYEGSECGAINTLQIQNMRILRDACNGSILVYSANENEYKFIHRSMLEYFATEQAFESSLAEYDLILGQTLDNTSAIYGETEFGRALIKDRDILSQLAERMSFEYKKILFKLIRVSKENSKLHRISANAITILNEALVCFSGQDYRDIQIQGADLRQSICAIADFRGANLSNVQFGESYLVGAQFQGACMENVDFGELPILKLSARLNTIASYRDQNDSEDSWVIATGDGAVRIWDTLEEKCVLPQIPNFRSGYDTHLSLLHGRVAVWQERSKYDPNLEISIATETYEVTVYDLLPEWMFFRKHTFQTEAYENRVYIQFNQMDKCVFIYSTCHLEVLSYEPTTDTLVTIGDGDPNRILTFVSIVDKNGDILVACIENCGEGEERQIAVYEVNEGCKNFHIINYIRADPKSCREEKLEFGEIFRILFKPDGTGLAIYGYPTNLQVFENFSEMITPIGSDDETFPSFVFDKTGKYLAGSSLDGDTVMIWNIPSGTIHRQFQSPKLPKACKFSYPFAFSSDSKVLALGGSEFHSESVIKLKLIDESPSVHDLLRQKTVDDVAVSDDGRIVVIGGKNKRRRFNYIEIFEFPFQSSRGLYVCFPKDVDFDTCVIGIINSKCSTIFKKIIVSQEEHCRAIVVCSTTGNILQNFLFDETLDVNEDHFTCVNRQTSLCCIYSKLQGCLFWEIFENDDNEIIFQRKAELELLVDTGVKVEELRFDYTGRYLQIVSCPLVFPPDDELSKIMLFDTKEKTTNTIKVMKSADICIGSSIQSAEADMINNSVFYCTFNRLLIYNVRDGTLFQKVDYYFNTNSDKLHFDPFSGWLFATRFEDCSVAIFQEKESQWGLALEIPIWFPPRKCVIYEKNNNISVLVSSGKRDLCYIEFDKSDCHSWRLLWSMKHCHKLKLWKSNVERTLRLSKGISEVLKDLGTSGEPHQNIKSQYLAFSDWCQEIFGTARSKFHSPFVKTAQNNFILSENMWVVSLVGNLSNIRKWRAHVYLIVEGIKNNRRFITRIHLTYPRELDEVSIVISPVVDNAPFRDHSWENSKYIEFVHLAQKLSAQQYGMSKGECEQFLRNIQADMQVKLKYNVWTQNCGVWCEKQLKKVGRDVSFECFTSALIFPRVFKLLNEMNFLL